MINLAHVRQPTFRSNSAPHCQSIRSNSSISRSLQAISSSLIDGSPAKPSSNSRRVSSLCCLSASRNAAYAGEVWQIASIKADVAHQRRYSASLVCTCVVFIIIIELPPANAKPARVCPRLSRKRMAPGARLRAKAQTHAQRDHVTNALLADVQPRARLAAFEKWCLAQFGRSALGQDRAFAVSGEQW
jgi:hypothetical protein